MQWSKKHLHELYRQKFCLELSDTEVDTLWENTQTLTPIGDKMNVAATPLIIRSLFAEALQRSNCTLNHTHFKKMQEELSPAVDFALFLKKIGLGEHLICLSDNPDIILINKDNIRANSKSNRRVGGAPLEVTFIKDESFEKNSASTVAQNVASALSKKLLRSYSKHTTLLVVMDATTENMNLEELLILLKDVGKNFRHIYVYMQTGDNLYVMARVYPDLSISDPITTKDLVELLY